MARTNTQTARYMKRLARLKPGRSLVLTGEEGDYGQLALWRHAAKKLGRQIEIKTLPDGVRIFG